MTEVAIDRQLAVLGAAIVETRKVVDEAREVADSSRATATQMEAIMRAKLEDHERRLKALEKRNGKKTDR
jgi:hypothetical protein